MKSVYLVRHAKSSWDNPSLSDIDRPLNKRGKRDIAFMPEKFVDRFDKPDLIITSGARRATQTAFAFMNEFGYPEDHLVEEKSLYLADTDHIYEVIFGIEDMYNRIMLFGHNPGFTEFANFFSDVHIQNVPTCGIVLIECEVDEWSDFAPDNGRIIDFIYPKQFI